MVQMLSQLKPLGRPKQPRPTAKLHNTTIRDFGGGLNVVDSEQNLTSRFSPVFDNMVTYTDRKTGPRFGYEMWLKLRQEAEWSGAPTMMSFAASFESSVVVINWPGHPFGASTFEHITMDGWTQTVGGITPAMLNRTHGIRRKIDDDNFEIVVSNRASSTGQSTAQMVIWSGDRHALGGEPIEAKYFSNYVFIWSSIGEIIAVDRNKNRHRVWSSAIAYARPNNPIAWTTTNIVASDIFGKELICSNGREKPLSIDVTRDVNDPSKWVAYLVDPGNASSNDKVPAFDACKTAFRFFNIHDTDASTFPEFQTNIRISAKDAAMVYFGAPNPAEAVDIDMSKNTASPEQTVRSFAVIKDALLVITPTATTMLKLGIYNEDGKHDPLPVDTLNNFGSNAPRSVVEVGSDVFMVDFNGVPSAKLSTVSNSVVPERVSNYVETMISKHIGRLAKETMRLKTFGFFDGKNKTVHYYLPKFDASDQRFLTPDPFYYDSDMALNEYTKSALIMRHDAHQLEQDDEIIISGATAFSIIPANAINGQRKILGVLNEDYLLVSIGFILPIPPIEGEIGGGGTGVSVRPVNQGSVGYAYHYIPAMKLLSWSRWKTPNNMTFNCGCSTVEGRSFLFTKDGYMMRYGSMDAPVYGDWFNMYDKTWTTATNYTKGQRILDNVDALVYRCLEDTTELATTFREQRDLEPDKWEEYRGDPVCFTWELPWADFGNRQTTKALRFCHVDANGQAQFKLSLFADNIYKDAATGQLTPARSLKFVPNDVGAFGVGMQTYGGGRRTREQRLWQVPIKFKLLKVRVEGATTSSLSVSALSFLSHRGSPVRG